MDGIHQSLTDPEDEEDGQEDDGQSWWDGRSVDDIIWEAGDDADVHVQVG